MSLDTTQTPAGWTTAGPVAQAYGESRVNGSIAVCVGPTGGGKTTESIRRTIRIAQWQHPSPIDGIRKARIIVLAPTYRKLWDQVVGSYKDEIPWATKEGGWTGGKGEPCEHIYDFMWRDHAGRDIGRVHVEVMFRAPGEGDLEDFFRGLKATAFWVPEMDTHETVDLVSLASNRTHRYPEMRDRPDPDLGLPDAYGGVYGDANAPVIGSWFHDRFILQRKPSDILFLQPPGYDPNSPDGFHPLAENQRNLRRADRNFYKTKAANHEEHDIRRLLMNESGWSRHGKPVHLYFNAITMSAAERMEVDRSLPVVIGMDVGSNTMSHAAVFKQRTWGGQVRALGEFAPDGQTDIVEACTEIRRIRETRFRLCERVELVLDPAARGQSAMRKGVTWAQVVQQITGLPVRLAPTNDPNLRRGASDQLMRKQAAPGVPAYMVDAGECPKLMSALAGAYRYKKNGDKVSPTPEKNDASHVAEANQYADLGLAGIGPVSGVIHPDDDYGHDASMAAILPS
jgi:hypothetical protein